MIHKLLGMPPKILGSFCFTYLLFFSTSIFSSIEDYIFPFKSPSFSNYGTLGVIQMPNARMHKEGTLAFSWTNNDPYLRGSIVAYPFKWFEASYQYTDVNNALYSNISSFSGSQSYKDKAFDTKFLLKDESIYLPAIAVGIRDIAGSGIFSSEYLVASKMYRNIDFTFGIGWGVLNKNTISNPLSEISSRFEERTFDLDTRGGEFDPGKYFSGDAGLFAGVELFLPNANGARIKIEYDGTDYDNEGFNPGKGNEELLLRKQKSQATRMNVGYVYPISDSFHLRASYTKGNTFSIGFNASINFSKKEPITPKKDKYIPIQDSEAVREISDKENFYLYRSALYFMNDKELFLQAATQKDETLAVAYMQNHHTSSVRATGRVAQTLDEIMPDKIKTFEITSVNAAMGMHTAKIDRTTYSKYKPLNFYKLASQNIELEASKYAKEDYEFQPETKYPIHFWKITPDIRSQIGGPDGFYFGDIRLIFKSELLIRKKLTLLSTISTSVYDNFDDLKLLSDSVLPHVRTDIVEYLKEGRELSIDLLQLNYFDNPSSNLYTKIAMGICESMFGCAGGEILYRPFDKNYAIGIEAYRAKQREYKQMLGFRDYETTTGLLSTYLYEPKYQVTTLLQGGKFLAGDSGIRVDISRRFKSGMSVGIFAARTDISKEEFGEGSFDKGFYFWIPLESFFSNYQRGHTGFGMRPVTRDGAATLNVSHPLYAVTESASAFTFTRDWDDLYD